MRDQPTFVVAAFAGGITRFLSLDIARGAIMIVMALDHASMFWNAGRAPPEFALPGMPLTHYGAGWQQLTREITHICAPGFQLLAGLGMGLSVYRRQRAGAAPWTLSTDMLLRAAALFFCEWVLLGVLAGMPPFNFIVLSCIGSATAIFAFARGLPPAALAGLSLAVLLASPLYGPTQVVAPSAGEYLSSIWTRVALTEEPTGYGVIYPILPWIGYFGIGWVLAPWYAEGRARARMLVAAGTGLLLVGVTLRWFAGSYGDRFGGGDLGPWTAQFWVLAKYPPSPAFSSLTLGAMLLLIGLLMPLDRSPKPSAAARFVAVYGRTALFFYVIHFYLLGAYPAATGTYGQYRLPTTYLVWLSALVILWPLCLLYGKLRRGFPRVLRYF